MLTRLRPWQFFESIPDSQREMNCLMPHRSSGFRLLDLAVVTAMLRSMRMPFVWNIGSFTGETLHLLAENCPEARFKTIDLPPEVPDGQFVYQCDAGLHLKSVWDDRYNHPQIQKYIGDSRRFDWSRERTDVVIIDGAHDLTSVALDTFHAFDVVRDSTQPAIIWHDYGNKLYNVTLFLDELAIARDIIHVEESICA
jgi:hypothetical protein